MSERIRMGDTVLHRPTQEKWLVAYADYERNELAWMGWPAGYARIEDCELIARGSEKQRRFVIEAAFQSNEPTDHRVSRVCWEVERALTGAGLGI